MAHSRSSGTGLCPGTGAGGANVVRVGRVAGRAGGGRARTTAMRSGTESSKLFRDAPVLAVHGPKPFGLPSSGLLVVWDYRPARHAARHAARPHAAGQQWAFGGYPSYVPMAGVTAGAWSVIGDHACTTRPS